MHHRPIRTGTIIIPWFHGVWSLLMNLHNQELQEGQLRKNRLISFNNFNLCEVITFCVGVHY